MAPVGRNLGGDIEAAYADLLVAIGEWLNLQEEAQDDLAVGVDSVVCADLFVPRAVVR